MLPNMQVQMANSPSNKRVLRKPVHSFHLNTMPFAIQPFMIAPVLAGETMKNLLMQARVVTDPIKNPLIGWWTEYYFFYVKLRDLDNADIMENMLLDQDADISTLLDGTASAAYYHYNGINYTKRAVTRIVEEYFRDTGEAALTYLVDGLPMAQVSTENWTDSVYSDSEMPSETYQNTGTGTDTEVNLPNFDALYQKWLFMRAQKMTEMDFEDYLKTFGVNQSKIEDNKPELVRYLREWSYPTNTIDPATGAPSSAVSWAVSERADKDRFFSEPGFLVGVTVARPKVYLGGQRESASHLFKNAMTWLPAMLNGMPQSSIVKMAQDTGPLGGVYTDGDYWADVRDVLTYGDQFLNVATTTEGLNIINAPKNGGNASNKYPDVADIEALFVTEGEVYVKQDGVVNLSILGHQIDHT